MAETESRYDATESEKLNVINSELNTLYCQVRQLKIPLSCLKESSKPFLNKEKKEEKHSFSSLTKCSFIIGLLSCLVYCSMNYDPLQRNIIFASRKAFIKVIPLWDWRWIRDEQCFVSNPLKNNSQEPELEDCKTCVNITDLERLNNTGESLLEKIALHYLDKDIPVVVENVTALWPNRGLIDVKKLKQLYLDDEVMMLYMCCDFESNIRVRHGNHRSLLRKLVEENISHYYAQWQNCFKESAKLFRQVYNRPEFLPSTVQLSGTNWVFISSQYTPAESKYIPLPKDDVFTMLIQLEGHMDIILEPVTACSKLCHPIVTRLSQGSALILTDFLYTAKYRPSKDEESITVGVGGSVDH